MQHSSSFAMCCRALVLALVFAAISGTGARALAQEPSADGAAPTPAAAEAESGPDAQAASEARAMPETIGGGGEPVRGSYYYTSPLEKLGTDMFFASYVISAAISIVYLAGVYPVQALFGNSNVEPVLLWMLLPVAGPWFAQYEDSVRSKPFWRVVLVGDAALQATGVVLGLLGLALGGRRSQTPTAASHIEWNLGVAGAGLAGVTLSVSTL